MKIAIIGSRNLTVENLEKYLPLGGLKLYQAGQRELILVPETMPTKKA